MIVGIVGLGMVGEAVAFGLKRIGHTVLGYDTNPDKTKCEKISDLLDTEILFICVPTPLTGFQCDTTIVEEVVAALSCYRGLVVIKSTVTPGTTEALQKKWPKLRIAFCPEFLRERARFYDFYENHELLIMGTNSSLDAGVILEAHGSIPKNRVLMSPTEAELAKYFVNCFNAYRINFANAFFDICQNLGVDYKRIKDAVTHRADTSSAYLESNEGFREFGGACLPKDTQAFASFVHKLGLYTSLFAHIVAENDRVTRGISKLSDAFKESA